MNAQKKGTASGKLRRYQRTSCDIPAEFHWGTIYHSARIKVLSIGGCFLATDVKIPLEEKVHLSFRLKPEDAPVTCECKVVWITRRGIKVRGEKACQGFALEFEKIYPEDRSRIDELVRGNIRTIKAIEHELDKKNPDKKMIKELFQTLRPGESTHLSHIKKTCREEKRFYRLQNHI
ncbi:MAG: PilZ domain-containing protein [bacterium]